MNGYRRSRRNPQRASRLFAGKSAFHWSLCVTAGKTVLITGASSGIGRATAELFAENGWTVAATMRRLEDSVHAAEVRSYPARFASM